MQLIDPTVKAAEQSNVRAPKMTSLQGTTIGLLSNGKANADRLLEETAALFQAEHHCRVLEVVFKRNASAPAPQSMIDDLADRCDFLLTANGD